MRIALVGLLLGACLLTTACGESEPTEDERRYVESSLDAFGAEFEEPAFAPMPGDDAIPGSRVEIEEEAPDAAPGDGAEAEPTARSSFGDMGRWSGIRAFWTFLGGGGVLMMLVVFAVALVRRTTLSMDLAVRSSRRRYLNRCKKRFEERDGR